jgi:MFS transporter, DHA1 family, multidrug resistance protein
MPAGVVITTLVLLLGIQPITTDLYLPAGLFTVLAASSFVYIGVLGLSRPACGAVLASFSLFYVIGTVLCRKLLGRFGLRPTVAIGGGFSLAGGLLTALLSIVDAHHVTVWAAIAPISLFMIGHGIHQPCAQAGAIGPFPDKAGTAASVSGFLMMLVAFGVGVALGRTLNGTVLPLTLGVDAFGIAVATVAWTWVQRHGEPQRGSVVTQALTRKRTAARSFLDPLGGRTTYVVGLGAL